MIDIYINKTSRGSISPIAFFEVVINLFYKLVTNISVASKNIWYQYVNMNETTVVSFYQIFLVNA